MEHSVHIPTIKIGNKKIDIFPYWLGLLGLGLLLGVIGGYQVLTRGLAVTGLTDQVPWGLWITIDLSAIGLGGSAFVFGVIVYLLQYKRFQVVGRLAIVLGFLGYSTAALVLFFFFFLPLWFSNPLNF